MPLGRMVPSNGVLLRHRSGGRRSDRSDGKRSLPRRRLPCRSLNRVIIAEDGSTTIPWVPCVHDRCTHPTGSGTRCHMVKGNRSHGVGLDCSRSLPVGWTGHLRGCIAGVSVYGNDAVIGLAMPWMAQELIITVRNGTGNRAMVRNLLVIWSQESFEAGTQVFHGAHESMSRLRCISTMVEVWFRRCASNRNARHRL